VRHFLTLAALLSLCLVSAYAADKEDYIVISKKGNAYDGLVQIRQGKERGYPIKK
jgi:hypothetical protein